MSAKQITREMGISHTDFFRILPAVVGSSNPATIKSIVYIQQQSGTVKIRLGPEEKRRLGSLSLPVTMLSFSFDGFQEHQIEEFMRRFDLCFRRGGG